MRRRIILASASPRRRELLSQVGIPFEVIPADVPEQGRPETDPCELARTLALEKAQATAARIDDGLVLGADTIVVLDSRILGKPADAEDARAMLRALSGCTHQVITGVVLIDRQHGETVATDVAHAVAVGKAFKDKHGTDARVLPAGNDVARLAPLKANRAQVSAMGVGAFFA
ncbi:MAG TPA: Maf family protein, partial [Armatimonadota bacterium]|nr:Maf family protein [Armatimonadota bacterium]